MPRIKKTKILVVARDNSLSILVRDILAEEGRAVYTAGSLPASLGSLRNNMVGIVILELFPSYKRNLEIIQKFKAINPEALIIAIINTPSSEFIRQALRLGIYDYLINPFNLEELIFVVKNAIKVTNLVCDNEKLLEELGRRSASMEKHAAVLEKEGFERVRVIDRLYQNLQDTYMRTIKTLIQAIDARDHYTHNHSRNVARYAVSIAKQLNLNPKEIEEIREACALHDLGKIAIQDYILTKPSKLNAEEWRQMKLHSLKGAQILSPLGFLDGVIDLVRQHHERFDGKGYPDGIKGEDIPLGARIMAVADAYDAMVSRRPYKKRPLSKREAIAELKNNSGTQFDQRVVAAFLKIVKKY